jgi:Holliday junction resolvase RusA-like endonuclease
MTQQFFIEGQLPGFNEFINAAKGKFGAERYTKLKQVTEKTITYFIRQKKIKPCTKPVHVRVIWGEPNRKRDRDNVVATVKCIMDALRSTGILRNDTWKWVLSLEQTVALDSEFPGVLVTLEEENA